MAAENRIKRDQIKIFSTLLIVLVTIYGCSEIQPKSSSDLMKEIEIIESPKNAESREIGRNKKFKYDHLKEFHSNQFKDDSLTRIDSIFHHKILSQLSENWYGYYDDQPYNFFISDQNDIGNLNLFTVSVYWDICLQGIYLLILDEEDDLKNYLLLTEWYSGCGMSSEYNTHFRNDSVFQMSIRTTHAGDTTQFVHYYKYEGLIKRSGEIDTVKVIIDTTEAN